MSVMIGTPLGATPVVYEERGYFISADLGQVNDYTAINVIERIMRPPGKEYFREEMTKEYHLRHIERPERGTPYPDVVNRIQELYYSPELRNEWRTVVLDITGVGRPVWDLMRKDSFFRGDVYGMLYGISITGGREVTRDGALYNVPKRDLISALQVAFQNGELKIARGLPESATLVKELTNFKVKINLNGHDQYEAWREGIHDDLVLSTAMGVWLASNARIRMS